MTFASLTASLQDHRFALAITIQGVPQVFADQGISPASLFQDELSVNRDQLPVLLRDRLSVGDRRLNMEDRLEEGSTLSFVLQDQADGPLQALIRPYGNPETFVESTTYARTVDPSTIRVGSLSGLASSGVVYIGAETIRYTGLSTPPNALSGTIVRGFYGSHRSRIDGGARAEVASDVFLHPPFWEGREVTLWVGYVEDDGTIGEMAEWGRWVLTGEPEYLGGGSDGETFGQWRFDAESLWTTLAQAEVMVGLRDVAPEEGTVYTDTTINLPTASGRYFAENTLNGQASELGHVLAKLGGEEGISLRQATAIGAFSVTVDTVEAVNPTPRDEINAPLVGPISPQVESVRYVFYDTGDPTEILLKLLCSWNGDGLEEATWDALPGRERDSVAGDVFGSPEWFFGARLAAYVDVATFETFIGQGPAWTVYLEKPTKIVDILRDWALAVGAVVFVQDGKITAAALNERTPRSASQQALTDGLLVRLGSDDAVTFSTDGVVDTFSVRANLDPFTETYHAELTVSDEDIRRGRGRRTRAKELDLPWTTLTWETVRPPRSSVQRLVRGPGLTEQEVETMLRRRQRRDAKARREVDRVDVFTLAALNLGQVVAVTNPRQPDGAGGTVATTAIVVAIQGVDFAGEYPSVRLRLRLTEPGYQWAPAARISSTADAGVTVNLRTGAAERWLEDDTKPAREFAVGWRVRVVRQSVADGISAETTITAINSDTQITLAAWGEVWSAADGDLLICMGPDGSDTPNQAGRVASGIVLQAEEDGGSSSSKWM